MQRASRYQIEAELGRLHLPMLDLCIGSQTIFRSGREVLPQTSSREAWKSVCFRELMIWFPCENSYRKSAKLLSRGLWRGEEQAVQSRTIANTVEREGTAIQQELGKIAETILSQHPPAGDPSEPVTVAQEQPRAAGTLQEAQVQQMIAHLNHAQAAARQLHLADLRESLEDPALIKANLSLDGVCCKKQKAQGRSKAAAPKTKGERVHHQVAHVQDASGRCYTLTATTLSALMKLMQAFLHHNGLLQAPGPLVFFLDGAHDLRAAIESHMGELPFKVLLDWYHLEKKCGERLSMACKNTAQRNAVLEEVLGWLWLGKVQQALDSLRGLSESSIKNAAHLQLLMDYLQRNQPVIPCYALRKRLGLRISSNPVEKANDLVVASRQKHNGMSWSVAGSRSLAALTCLALNHEQRQWLLHRHLPFQFATDAPPLAA